MRITNPKILSALKNDDLIFRTKYSGEIIESDEDTGTLFRVGTGHIYMMTLEALEADDWEIKTAAEWKKEVKEKLE